MVKSEKIGHKKQASNIHKWKPWLKAGVKTPEGKAIVSQNGWKHGYRSQEYTHFIRTLCIRGQVAREEIDDVLSTEWLMNLISDIENFKPSSEKNRALLKTPTVLKQSRDNLKDSIKKEYLQELSKILED